LGKCSGLHHRRCHWSAGGQVHPVALTPILFTGPCPLQLLPAPQGQEGAGRPNHDQGKLLEGVRGGCEDSYGGGLCQGVPAVVLLLQKVCCDKWQLCCENLEIKMALNITVFYWPFLEIERTDSVHQLSIRHT
jgi:hypothetical protein